MSNDQVSIFYYNIKLYEYFVYVKCYTYKYKLFIYLNANNTL